MYKEKKKKEKKIEREDNIAPTAFSPAVLFSLTLGNPSKGYRSIHPPPINI